MSKEVILTGIRSNGELHLGNYLGAIEPIVKLQKTHAGEYQVNMFVPDLHSFTTPTDHDTLYKNTIDNLRLFVAAGLDINNDDTLIYRQSYVPAHSELTWIFSCFTYFGELRRMTQFKDKTAQQVMQAGSGMVESLDRDVQDKIRDDKIEKSISSGLFIYPVLMAADILLYGAKWVPVGEDQQQHIELARDIASRFNNKFEDDLFTPPDEWKAQLEFMNRDKGARIRSLKNPEKKMSKSIEDPAGTILLSDSPGDAAKKIMSATTDSLQSVNLDWEKQPGVSNLLQILALLQGKNTSEVAAEWQGKLNYADLKKAAADQVSNFLSDFQAKLSNVSEEQILSKLTGDEQKINEIANANYFEFSELLV